MKEGSEASSVGTVVGSDVVWSTADLAQAGGVNTSRIRQLLLAGRLEGVKVGGRWLVADHEARRWLTSGRRTGRPPRKLKQLTMGLDEG